MSAKQTNIRPGGVLDDPIISSPQRDDSSSQAQKLRPFMRIVLDEMVNDPDPVAPGSQGTVVDGDEYQVIVDWDEEVGRSLHLIPGVDRYHVIDPHSPEELEKSFINLGCVQDRVRSKSREHVNDSRCPRCGKLFELRRGAVSRRICVTGISICPECGQQEAIEDFVLHSTEYGVNVDFTVPRNGNYTGYEAEVEGDKEKLKIVILPISKWYIVKVWTSGT